MGKTKQEIIIAANTLKNQADKCPEISYFDDTDNTEDIQYMYEASRQLYCAANGMLGEVTDGDVKSWLKGQPSALNDCLD